MTSNMVFTLVYGLLVAYLMDVPTEATACGIKSDFTLSDFADEGDAANHIWRGYRFTVKHTTTVTALRGGATEDGFEIALFSLHISSFELTEVLAAVRAETSRGSSVNIWPHIQLHPRELYLLAQGRESGSGRHFQLGNIDVEELIANHGSIDSWGPSTGTASYILGGTGKASDMIGKEANSENNFRLDIGFISHAQGFVGLHVKQYANEAGSGNVFWRGYKFILNTGITVTRLTGGGTEDGFEIAIFELDSVHSNRIDSVVISEFIDNAGRAQELGLAQPVTLQSGVYYYFAQGQSSGTGAHYYVGTVDVPSLLADHAVISEWGPVNGERSYRGTSGTSTAQVDETISTHNGNPDIGMTYYINPTLQLSDYGPTTTSSNGHHWRGYIVRFKVDIVVSALHGGGTDDGFDVGIFEFDEESQELIRKIQVVSVSQGRGNYAPLDIPILLPRATSFFFGQGRGSSGSGFHYALSSVNVNELKTDFAEFISDFHPANDEKSYRIATHNTDDLFGRPLQENSILPDIGLVFMPTEYCPVSTPLPSTSPTRTPLPSSNVCTNGTVLDDAKSTCKVCPPGRYSLQNYIECEKCRPGHYSEKEGSSVCTPCGRNSYQPQFGQSRCLRCSTGWYQFEVGQTTCIYWKEVKGLLPVQRPKRRVV